MQKDTQEKKAFYQFRVLLALLIALIFSALFIASEYIKHTKKVERPLKTSSQFQLIKKSKRTPYHFKKLLANNSGSITYINYWAFWCAPCLRELPLLIKVRREILKNGHPIKFIFYNLDGIEYTEKAKTFVKKTLNGEILFQQSKLAHPVAKLAQGLPYHQIIDSKFLLALSWRGEIQSEQKFLSIFNTLLEENHK